MKQSKSTGQFAELIKYGFWGVVTTAFNLAVFYMLVAAGVNYIFANVLSYFLAVILSYFLNKIFVFKIPSEGRRSAAIRATKFTLIRLASIAADSGLLYLCVSIIKADVMFSKILVSAVIILATYILNKLFV